MKRLIVFDLDGTLAESKSSIDTEMANLLDSLLAIVKVGVISGGAWPQFEEQVLTHLRHDDCLKNLSLLPTCGTKFYRHDVGWELLYSEDFTAAERGTIIESLQRAVTAADCQVDKVWGEVIEDRGSQITFSALGQQAPLEEKKKWDPDFIKRKKIKAVLDTLIPEFSVRLGGATSVDVTQQGIDKAYGIRKLRDILQIPIDQMIFIGDAVFPGGNDYPAKEAGVLVGYSQKIIGQDQEVIKTWGDLVKTGDLSAQKQHMEMAQGHDLNYADIIGDASRHLKSKGKGDDAVKLIECYHSTKGNTSARGPSGPHRGLFGRHLRG